MSELPFQVERTPLEPRGLSGVARLRLRSPLEARIEPSRNTHVLTLVFVLLGGGAVAAAAAMIVGSSAGLSRWLTGGLWCTAIPFAAVGLLFVVIGAGVWLGAWRKTIVLDLNRGQLIARRDLGDAGREISLRDVAAVQVLSVAQPVRAVPAQPGKAVPRWRMARTPDDWPDQTAWYEVNLVLSRPPGRRVHLFRHRADAARGDAAELARILGVPLLEHLGAPVRIGGELAEVDASPLESGSASFRSTILAADGPDRMVFCPSGGLKAFRAAFILVGLGALVAEVVLVALVAAGRLDMEPDAWWGKLIAVTVPGIVGTVFVLGGWRGMRQHPIVFDRGQGLILGPGLKLDGRPCPSLSLGDVLALQLCGFTVTGHAGDDDSQPYRCLQLNLVLRDPKAARVTVACHGKLDVLRQEAMQLAEFLGVPLLDHTPDAAREG